MIEVSCQASTSHFYTRFRAINDFTRDEVHLSVRCLPVVPHLARLSRLYRGRPRSCSRRLPARCAVFIFFAKSSFRSQVSIRTYSAASVVISFFMHYTYVYVCRVLLLLCVLLLLAAVVRHRTPANRGVLHTHSSIYGQSFF